MREFRKYTGMSILNYVNFWRLQTMEQFWCLLEKHPWGIPDVRIRQPRQIKIQDFDARLALCSHRLPTWRI